MNQVLAEVWATGHNEVNVKPLPIDKCGASFGPGGIYIRKAGTAGTFKAGADLKKVIGIDLSAQSGYDHNVSITYKFPSEGGFLCGSNDYPSVARWDLMDPCNGQGVCVGSSSRPASEPGRGRVDHRTQ